MWEHVIIAGALLAGIYAFSKFIGFERRYLSRRARRRTQDLFSYYADRGRGADRKATRPGA